MATHGFTGVELALVPEPSTRRPISYNHSYHPSTSGLSTHSKEREGNVSRSPSQWSNLTGDDDEDDDLDEEASDGADDDDGDFAVTQTVHRTPVGASLGIDAALTATTVATAVLSSPSQATGESKDVDHDSSALVQTREQEIRERLALASTQRSANTTSPSVSRLRWSPFLEQPRYIMDDDDEDEDEENEEEFTVTRVLTNAAYVPTNNAQKRGLEVNAEKEKRGTREDKEVNEEGEEEDDEDGFAITHVINNHNNRSSVPPLPLSQPPAAPPAPQPLPSRSSAEDEEEEDGGFTITHVINNRQSPSTQRPVARNEDDTEDGFHITHTTRQRPFSSSSPAAAAIIQNDDVSSTAKGR